MPHLTQPLASHQPAFTNLENQLLFSWWQIPSTLVPGLLTTATSCKFSHPFTPHRSRYNIYIDNINNTSRPRLAHLLGL